jgi:hypothetical protein
MPPFLETYLSNLKHLIGVEVIQLHGEWYYNIVELKQIKNSIDIISNYVLVQDLAAIEVLQEVPVFVTINSQGIIHRTIDNKSLTIDNKIQSILPNAKIQDFYYQLFSMVQGEVLSIARKQTINDIIEDLQSKGLNILNITLGSFHVQYLLPLLRDKDIIHTSIHQLDFTNDELSDFSTNQEFPDGTDILIGQNWLNTILVVPFAAAFSGLLSIANHVVETPTITKNQEEFIWNRLFKISLTAILGIFLIGLTLNFILFTQYSKTNDTLSIQAALKEQKIQTLDTLQKKINEQQGLTNLLASKTSYYSDRIASSLPSDIELFELTVFPEEKQTLYDDNTLITYDNNSIIIKGNCKNSFIYNQWLKTLKNFDWAKEVKNVNYQDINEDYSEFELKIMMNDE